MHKKRSSNEELDDEKLFSLPVDDFTFDPQGDSLPNIGSNQ